ncbi:MAG: DUF3990 domain-containing protein [Candidatus Eremiobacteraeota bacterium]|nr:DUF3990 domain-containing protein [Candidatus Eremiobacteraeota bacterium]
MAWNNDPLTLWHGTIRISSDDIEANGISLNRCAPKRDFGRGFYTTRVRSQAILFANQKYQETLALHIHDPRNHARPISATIVEYSIDRDILAQLDALAFVGPTPDWVEFVRFCRAFGRGHNRSGGVDYDVVYGPVSNMRGEAWPDFEQLAFHTNRATSALNAARVRSHHGSPRLA